MITHNNNNVSKERIKKMLDYGKTTKIYDPEFVEEIVKHNEKQGKIIRKLKMENEAYRFTIDLLHDIINTQSEKINNLDSQIWELIK